MESLKDDWRRGQPSRITACLVTALFRLYAYWVIPVFPEDALTRWSLAAHARKSCSRMAVAD